MTETQVCPICKNPRRSSSYGSLTQWIVACNCDLRDVEVPEEAPSISICRDCGKRIGEGRAGSFTQFIFRSDVCRCQVPKPLRDALDAAQPVQESYYAVEELEEEELQFDNKSFPTDRYKPLAQLGSGAGGAVYLARDTVLNKKVAVKMLHMLEAKQLVAFQEEARATSKLSHPSIVGVIDFGLTGSATPYMVLEYFPGMSLQSVLERDGHLEWPVAQKIAEQVCNALAYAHSIGVYHRDIKPSNILMQTADDGSIDVRIIDFGIAKVKSANQERTSALERTLVGAPLYMSPDVGLGLPYDSRSEVYSLACVIFEMMTGKPPFEGESAFQTLALHAKEKPPKLMEVNPDIDVPRALENLVAKALAKKPADRFQNMDELRTAILDIDPVVLRQTSTFIGELPDNTPYAVPLKTLSVVAVIGICLFIVAKMTILAPPPPVSMVAIEKAKQEKEKRIEIQKNKEEVSELKTEEILKELNLTGGKWNRHGKKGDIEGHEVNDEDFKEIGDIGNARGIKVTLESRVTGTGFKYIKDQPISSVLIMSHLFNDEGAAELSKIKTIRRLCFHYDNKLTAKGYRMMAEKLPNLATVQMRFMNIPKGAIEALQPAEKRLTHLDLGHSEPITTEDLQAISKMTNLRALTLTNTPIDDEGVKYFLPLTQMAQMDIGETPMTDEALMIIARGMPSVKGLKITVGSYMTSLGVKRFNKLRPGVKITLGDGLEPFQLININQ